MRLAPLVRPVFLGLPFLVCQLAITVPSSLAWEMNLFRAPQSTAEIQIPAAKMATGAPTPAARPTSRWTNPQATSQTSAIARSSSVPSQQEQFSAGNTGARQFQMNRSAAPARQSSRSATNKRGPLFHGYELRLPNTLFGRNKEKVSVPPQANNQAFSTQQRLAASSSVRSMSSPTPNRTNYAIPTGQQHKAIARSTSRTSMGTKASGAFVHQPTPAPAVAPIAADITQTASAPKTPAEQLVAQAHEWSGAAESEEEFSRIIETCRRARASQPSGSVSTYANGLAAWALNRRGQLKAEAGQTKEALLDFDDAIRADAKCWRAIHNRGVLLAQDGQFEKAFDDFNRTIECNPEFAKAYSNRGALFVVANNLSEASQDYARAIELDPNLAVAHRGRGRVCHLLGKLEDAIGHYDAAVQLAPDDAYAVACRADLLTDLGRYVDAAAGYDEAIKIDPNSLQAFSGSAWLLATCPDRSVRDPELAVERAGVAIELSGKEDAVTFDTLAAAQASAGDFAAATKTVRQAIELASPEDRDVYHDRLMLYQHAKPYRIAPVRPVTQASYQE